MRSHVTCNIHVFYDEDNKLYICPYKCKYTYICIRIPCLNITHSHEEILLHPHGSLSIYNDTFSGITIHEYDICDDVGLIYFVYLIFFFV